MGTLKFTILGCGSSAGVPRIGNDWGACDPGNPKNRRLRCALLVEKTTKTGTTTALIDTGPDLREQLLATSTSMLDGVVYTHAHADHLHGIDDLRVVVYNRKSRLPVYADADTTEALTSRFGYVFETPKGSNYPPVLDLNPITGPVIIDGPGGQIELSPFTVQHGRINALGFRIGQLAYLPDVSEIPANVWPMLDNLDVWIIDALRYEPHPTHAHLEKTLEWISRARPNRAILTNMHIDLDYETVAKETPDHVSPAYDGMVVELPS